MSASDYKGDFRVLGSTTDLFSPPGRESQISLLVGGNYNGLMGEEIEGRIVVLGDFIIGPDGVDSIGTWMSHWISSKGMGMGCHGWMKGWVSRVFSRLSFVVVMFGQDGVVPAVASSPISVPFCKWGGTLPEERSKGRLNPWSVGRLNMEEPV
jgi:hypothetical protein